MKPSGRARLAPSSTISSSAFFCFFGGKSKDLQKRSPEVLFIYFQLKAECWRIDAFELWCWRRLLRIPWTARRSNQSILKENSSGYSLEGLMLKLQYFGHLMWRTDWFEKTLMLRKIEGGRRRGQRRMSWMASPTQWTWAWVSSWSWWWTGRPGVLWFMGSQRVGHDSVTELNWLNFLFIELFFKFYSALQFSKVSHTI